MFTQHPFRVFVLVNCVHAKTSSVQLSGSLNKLRVTGDVETGLHAFISALDKVLTLLNFNLITYEAERVPTLQICWKE